MSKLPEEYRFVDLSDYGRSPALWIAKKLSHSYFTPIHVTSAFILSGLLAIYCILSDQYVLAAILLILKSILDAADGALARINGTPSYVGRYYDSIADIILNFCFVLAIGYVSDTNSLFTFLAFIAIQLQGTLYNYYYVILRNAVQGDTTSRIIEKEPPIAMIGESQKSVNLFFKLFYILYAPFDTVIRMLDPKAIYCPPFPKWYMTALSVFGLGFQLLIMACFLILGRPENIIPFFIGYSFLIIVLVSVRRGFLDRAK